MQCLLSAEPHNPYSFMLGHRSCKTTAVAPSRVTGHQRGSHVALSRGRADAERGYHSYSAPIPTEAAPFDPISPCTLTLSVTRTSTPTPVWAAVAPAFTPTLTRLLSARCSPMLGPPLAPRLTSSPPRPSARRRLSNAPSPPEY